MWIDWILLDLFVYVMFVAVSLAVLVFWGVGLGGGGQGGILVHDTSISLSVSRLAWQR